MKDKEREHSEKIGHTYWQWTFTILADMTIFTYGLDVGWVSPMAKILQSDQSPAGEPVSDAVLSWIASTICLGAVFSAPVYSYIASRFGSKASVIATAVPQAISWIIRIFFTSGPGLIISRTFSGFAAGGCFNALVIYVKEISQDNIRGVLGSMRVFFSNSGVFVMYLMGIYLDYYTILYIVSGVPIVTGILLLKAPESPEFLVKQGKIEEATAMVAFLRGLSKDHKLVESEVTRIRAENDFFKTQPNMMLMNIMKNPIWRRGMIVTTIIISVQAMNGSFAIMTYASIVLKSTGVKLNVSPETLTLGLPVVMMMGSSFSTICMEKFRRKSLMMFMLFVSVCSMLSIAIAMLLRNYGAVVPFWLPVMSMMGSVWAFSGVSSMPFIIMAEMFSFQIRAKVFGLIVTHGWLLTFISIVGYLPLSNAVGLAATFFVFAGINLFGMIFVFFFLPETRGKSVEQIEEDISNRIGRKVNRAVT